MRWGFIGASNIAERVIPSLRKLEGQTLAGVYSRGLARAKEFAAQQSLASASDDLEDFLTQGRFDAVYISSTNELHMPQTLTALAHGCHVMCEKPLAMSQADAAQMVARARSAGRVLGTNHHLRASAVHQRVRELIQGGELGQVHGVQVSHAVHLPPHLQGWRLDSAAAGGGVVLDILVHDADLLRFLLGREPLRIATRTLATGMAREGLEDSAMSVIEFDGGTLAQTHESFAAAHALTRLHVLGTQGSLYAEGSLTQAGDGALTLRNAHGTIPVPVPAVDLYERGFERFVQACAGQGAPLASGEDGARAMAVALAGLQSARSGQVETISFSS
jgi:1,5-anhydro-D-fructose reductase (1,5-anhydro-D-mannitol-forming)